MAEDHGYDMFAVASALGRNRSPPSAVAYVVAWTSRRTLPYVVELAIPSPSHLRLAVSWFRSLVASVEVSHTTDALAHHRIEAIDGGPYLEQVVPDTLGAVDEAVAAAVDVDARRNAHEVY